MSRVTGMLGMSNNIVYAREEITSGAFLWHGERELSGRGHVATYPTFKMVTSSDNDNRRHYIMGLPSRQ